MRRYGCLLLAGWLILAGCNEFQQAVKDAKKDIPPPPKDNYIVLLDLSDRVLYNNQQQVPKDIAVVQSIYRLFKSKLDAKDPTHLYYNLHDKLKVLIAPQKTTPKALYDMVGSLRIDLSAEQPDKKVAAVDETEKTFASTLPAIYKLAVIGNNSAAYSGADIWSYFNEDLADDLEKDGQNTLLLITDGYMDLEKTEERPAQNNRFASCSQVINALKKYPDWETRFTVGDYGMLPIAKKFPNLKVVLLQVNPHEDWMGEFSLLTKIWGKWFTEMGISNYRFIKDDNVNEVKESLEKFMDVKIAGKLLPVNWTKITDTDSSLMLPPIAQRSDKNLPLIKKPIPATVAAIHPPKPAGAKPSTHVFTHNAGIPDESDASILTGKKKSSPTEKIPSKADDDILKDRAPVNGFNTGIKKEPAHPPITVAGKRQ